MDLWTIHTTLLSSGSDEAASSAIRTAMGMNKGEMALEIGNRYGPLRVVEAMKAFVMAKQDRMHATILSGTSLKPELGGVRARL